MEQLKQLIHEIHRRSLWQVTGIFLAASWGVLQVVEVLTETAGLPDWTPSMALVLLLIGLPIVLATAFVQEGMPGEGGTEGTAGTPGPDSVPGTLGPGRAGKAKSHRLLTWRNAILGGAGAFLLLGAAVAAYLIMWSAGIGPVGNLLAQGVIARGDKVVLADFDDATGEGLGAVVTEALRVDLAQTPVIDLVEESELTPVLGLMQAEPGATLTVELAREVAERAGFAAVLHGSVAAAGTGYVVTATINEVESGRSVATFRASAADPASVIATIDELSQDIREKVGESLRTIRAGQPLDRVTTSSLEALRLYSEAQTLFDTDPNGALDLLQRSVEIDPEFAMAWRKLAALHFNLGTGAEAQSEAATRAYESRHRLTDKERYLAEAFYHQAVSWEPHLAIEAYRNVLRIDPMDAPALNNLGNAYYITGEYAEARTLWERAVDGPGTSSSAYGNLVIHHLQRGDPETAARVLARWQETFPEAADLPEARFHIALLTGAHARADSIARAQAADVGLSPVQRSAGAFWLAKLAYREGRLEEARAHLDQSVRAIETIAPPLASGRRAMGVRAEVLLGDPGFAADRIDAMISDGSLVGDPAFAQFPGLVATLMAYAGRPDLVERLRSQWTEADRPGAENPFGEEGFLRADIVARAVAGNATGAQDELDELIAGLPCSIDGCWVLERATVANAVGDVEQAIRWYEAVAGVNEFFYELLGVTDLHADMRLGPLYEEVGDTAAALATYRRIVDLWSDADEPVRSVVERYRERVQALQGG